MGERQRAFACQSGTRRPVLTVPVAGGELCCGTWQQIVLLELDANAGRERSVICTVTGE